jgi:hypothetical protein
METLNAIKMMYAVNYERYCSRAYKEKNYGNLIGSAAASTAIALTHTADTF